MKECKSMRKVSLVSILLVFALLCGFCAYGENANAAPASKASARVNESGNSSLAGNLSSSPGKRLIIRMLNRTSGWLLTDQQVLKTQDGGLHWTNVTPKGSTFNQYSRATFADTQHTWVVSPQSDKNVVTVISTTDGGQHWHFANISVPGPLDVDMAHFWGPNYQTGWLMVNDRGGATGNIPADLYQTHDGGLSWHFLSHMPFTGFKYGVSFVDGINGFAGGISHASNTAWFYATHNAGATWQEVILPNLPGSTGTEGADYQTLPPVFFGSTGILPVGVEYYGHADTHYMLYRSTDRGKTWSSSWKTNGNAVFAPCNTYYDKIYVADINHIYTADTQRGTFCVTSNSGRSWSITTGNVGTNTIAIDFLDANNGWVISDRGLLHTTDGGNHWQKIN